MRQIAWFAVLILSSAALGQSPSSTDVLCTPLEHLNETACSFGDGSGEIVSPSSVKHFTAEEWGRMYPTLIKADDDAKAEQIRSNTEAEVRLRAESDKEIAA